MAAYIVVNTEPAKNSPAIVYQGNNDKLAMSACTRRAKKTSNPHYVKRIT